VASSLATRYAQLHFQINDAARHLVKGRKLLVISLTDYTGKLLLYKQTTISVGHTGKHFFDDYLYSRSAQHLLIYARCTMFI